MSLARSLASFSWTRADHILLFKLARLSLLFQKAEMGCGWAMAKALLPWRSPKVAPVADFVEPPRGVEPLTS